MEGASFPGESVALAGRPAPGESGAMDAAPALEVGGLGGAKAASS